MAYERVTSLDTIKWLVRTLRGPSSLGVGSMPLRDCPAAALLLERLARHDGWTVIDIHVMVYASELDKYLHKMAAVTLPRLLLVDSDSDSDTDSDRDAAGDFDLNPLHFIGNRIDHARELALQIDGSAVAELAGLVQLWQKLLVDDDASHDLLVRDMRAAIEEIRARDIVFGDPQEPQGQIFCFLPSPEPPRLGSPPPSPTPSPPPSPPPSLYTLFRALPARLPARRPEVWAPDHLLIDGLDSIKSLLKTSRRPPLVQVQSLATRDCPEALHLLQRLTRHAGWNVPQMYAIQHASRLDGVLNIMSAVTLPQLLLIPETERLDIHLLPMQAKVFDALEEAANCGGSVVCDLRGIQEIAVQLELHFMDLRPISMLAWNMCTEIARVRGSHIRFIEMPEPEAPVKDFSPSPSPPPLGSPQTPSP